MMAMLHSEKPDVDDVAAAIRPETVEPSEECATRLETVDPSKDCVTRSEDEDMVSDAASRRPNSGTPARAFGMPLGRGPNQTG